MKIELAMIVLGLCLVGCGGGGDSSSDDDAKRQAQAEKGLQFAKTLAEQGNASEQYKLALMYDNGQGVTQDDSTAYVWYTIAAASGNAYAKEKLSDIAKKMTRDQINKAKKLANKMIKDSPQLLGN